MDIITRIYEIYKEIDKTIENFQSATGMRCLSGCASCCREQWVDATVLGVLPLAMEVYVYLLDEFNRQGMEGSS